MPAGPRGYSATELGEGLADARPTNPPCPVDVLHADAGLDSRTGRRAQSMTGGKNYVDAA